MLPHTHLAIRVIQNCRNSADLNQIERFWKTFKQINWDDAEAISVVGEALRERKQFISQQESKMFL